LTLAAIPTIIGGDHQCGVQDDECGRHRGSKVFKRTSSWQPSSLWANPLRDHVVSLHETRFSWGVHAPMKGGKVDLAATNACSEPSIVSLSYWRCVRTQVRNLESHNLKSCAIGYVHNDRWIWRDRPVGSAVTILTRHHNRPKEAHMASDGGDPWNKSQK
jgi:hypothetical protein